MFSLIWNLFAIFGLLMVVVIGLVCFYIWKNDFFPIIKSYIPTNTVMNIPDQKEESKNTEESTATESGGFALTAAQKSQLVLIGIPEASIPNRLSASQEACLVTSLGQDRTNKIKNGAGLLPGDSVASACFTN